MINNNSYNIIQCFFNHFFSKITKKIQIAVHNKLPTQTQKKFQMKHFKKIS